MSKQAGKQVAKCRNDITERSRAIFTSLFFLSHVFTDQTQFN